MISGCAPCLTASASLSSDSKAVSFLHVVRFIVYSAQLEVSCVSVMRIVGFIDLFISLIYHHLKSRWSSK